MMVLASARPRKFHWVCQWGRERFSDDATSLLAVTARPLVRHAAIIAKACVQFAKVKRAGAISKGLHRLYGKAERAVTI